MLGPLRGQREARLSQYAPALAESFASGAMTAPKASSIRCPVQERINARYVPVGRARGGGVIFLEDLTRAQTQAQQMKLAALGRLTGTSRTRYATRWGDQPRRELLG